MTSLVLILKTHLQNVKDPDNTGESLYLGSEEDLDELEEEVELISKEMSKKKLKNYLNEYGELNSYPELPMRHYLVARQEDHFTIKLYAVYNFEQISSFEYSKNSSFLTSFEWRVIKLSESLQKKLLNVN